MKKSILSLLLLTALLPYEQKAAALDNSMIRKMPIKQLEQTREAFINELTKPLAVAYMELQQSTVPQVPSINFKNDNQQWLEAQIQALKFLNSPQVQEVLKPLIEKEIQTIKRRPRPLVTPGAVGDSEIIG